MSAITALAGTVSKARAVGWAVATCLALSAAALAWGVQLGRDWQRGEQAQLDVSALGRQVAEFTAALDTAAKDQQAAQAALAAIARSTADDLEKKRVAADAAARSLDRALAARPDLDSVRVGAGILRAWNAGNAADDTGTAAGAADADPSGERTSDDAVPGTAIGSRRPPTDAAAQSPGSGRAIPPVRRWQGRLGQVGARARADRGRTDCQSDSCA